MSESASSLAPARVLSTFDAACVVIGAIVGVGIFFSPGQVAALVETPTLALVAWSVGGVLALCGALAFAELGRRYVASGAQYQALRDAWGPLPAFVYVFCNATAIQAGAIGIIAIICANNLGTALGYSGEHVLSDTAKLIIASALILSLTIANVLGVKFGSTIQGFSVVSKILALFAVVGIAAWAKSSGKFDTPVTAPPPNAMFGPLGVMAALVPAFFAYGGWQHALWIAGEIKDPERTLPRAIIGGVIVVVIVYVSANWAYLSMLGHETTATSKSIAADAVARVFPGWGARAVAAAVTISAFGVLNAQLLSGPRLVYGMARDGRFFTPFARLGKSGTPIAAILLLGLSGLGLLLIAGFDRVDKLTTGVVFIDGVFFAMTAATLLKPGFIPKGHAPLPFARLAAGVFVLGELALLTGAMMNKDTYSAAWIGVVWIAVAGVLYLVKFRRRSNHAAD
ncbi:MAG: amino acid permease [Phycisphaerales bacterium]|nr:amino acid permease [Phycisphaerales bacterium]